jgi:hypothetical protein
MSGVVEIPEIKIEGFRRKVRCVVDIGDASNRLMRIRVQAGAWADLTINGEKVVIGTGWGVASFCPSTPYTAVENHQKHINKHMEEEIGKIIKDIQNIEGIVQTQLQKVLEFVSKVKEIAKNKGWDFEFTVIKDP